MIRLELGNRFSKSDYLISFNRIDRKEYINNGDCFGQ